MTKRIRGVAASWPFVIAFGCMTTDPPPSGGGGSDTNFLVCDDAGVCRLVACPNGECDALYGSGTALLPLPASDTEDDAGHPELATTGTVTGETGACTYSLATGECVVDCERALGTFSAQCLGPVGGAQSCQCKLNEFALCDEAANTDGCYPWYAGDCLEVAQSMADGRCEHIVDCCFTWTKDGTERCSCTGDPAAAGFESCEAAAQAGGGEVVDLCPKYETPSWDFPEPPNGGAP